MVILCENLNQGHLGGHLSLHKYGVLSSVRQISKGFQFKAISMVLFLSFLAF